MKYIRACIGIVALLAAFLSGCVQRGPVLVDFAYQAPKGAVGEAPKVIIGVSPFKDGRGISTSVAGKRINSLNNESSDLVVQGTVAEKVTTALKNALTARDIAIKDVPAWDHTDAGIPQDSGNLVMSGEIKTLRLDATSSLASTKVKATVELRILVADPEQKKIVRALNVSSTIERQHVRFTATLVQSTLSEALSIAMNQVFLDEELKKRLK
jgi:hypothetical protein